MQLGMIGLGRMGGNIVRRLMRHGHSTVVYDKDAKAVAGLAADGAVGSATLEDFISKLERPRTAWVMLPAGHITETTIDTIAGVLQDGDVSIDGFSAGGWSGQLSTPTGALDVSGRFTGLVIPGGPG
jgi:6-phosphogluconate dehydrogenase